MTSNNNRVLPNQEMVTISKKEYESLLDDSFKLSCFEGAGVDNWCGYDYAMQEYRNNSEEDDE